MAETVFPAFSHRADPSVPAFPDTGHVVVVDGTCGLCSRGARWMARHDRRGVFRIAVTGSDLGRALMRHYGLNPDDPDSWLYLKEGRALFGMEAWIEVLTEIGGAGRLARVIYVLPKRLRAALYPLVARNRYRFAGRADLCALPDPALQARLIG